MPAPALANPASPSKGSGDAVWGRVEPELPPWLLELAPVLPVADWSVVLEPVFPMLELPVDGVAVPAAVLPVPAPVLPDD
jgi:hypothetical protein